MENLENNEDLPNEYKNTSVMAMNVPNVNDRSRNQIQITAEQILKDPNIHDMSTIKFSNRIMDEEELKEYKGAKRKEFEDKIRKQKHHMGTWIKYGLWEEQLEEFRRARSVFERALDIDYKNVSVWLKYVEMEMRNKFVNHARNLWEKATKLLPRVDQFWFKYIYMEEMLGNYLNARNIFEKWITWKPQEKAWMAYVKFEERMDEKEKCRKVMYKYLDAFPKLEVYLKVAKFEAKNKHYDDARFLYEKALEDLGDEAMTENFFIQWAKFEIRSKEFNRARQIFRYGLDNLPKDKVSRLYEEFLKMEKQYGSRDEIDELVFDKRRRYYKELLEKYPSNYDAWFDLLLLEQESRKDVLTVRDTFEKAVSQVPPSSEKRLWKRYIYLWIMYANWEEIEAKDFDRSKSVYERVLKLIPHSEFTFAKLWIMFAHFFVRRKDLASARKIFGTAIGKVPREKIFQAYIDLEMQLTNFDRCRALYNKFITTFPDKSTVWIKYAEMEYNLEELERARTIYRTAISLPVLNMPEQVWKAYIDMEISLKEFDKARSLFNHLLSKTKHVKVWISFADFEKENKSYENMRKVFNDGDKFMTGKDNLKEQRRILLQTWLERETEIGGDVESVKEKQPIVLKKQRRVKISTGDDQEEEEGGWEEFEEYIFKEDAGRSGLGAKGIDGFKAPNIMKIAYQKKAEKERLEREKLKLAEGLLNDTVEPKEE
jgi:crooked neck